MLINWNIRKSNIYFVSHNTAENVKETNGRSKIKLVDF